MEYAQQNDEITGNHAEDEDDDDDKLLIDIAPRRSSAGLKVKQPKRKREEMEEQENEDDELPIDKSIEEKVQNCAKKNNLSDAEMRNLLRTVVKNDHVLALVKIQEQACTSDDAEEANTEANSQSVLITPKLTRSKARALNQKPAPIVPLSEIQPQPEVAALITEELHSDEDDEEYEPREEESASDDDANVTASDFDSQPHTPMTPATQCEDDLNCSRYTDDGLFKVPRERADSLVSNQDELIAQRTRSKVCLQETPIESIESNFVPPDIPTDMCDFDMDMDMDNAWAEFLTNFSKPLNDTHAEEDDEADPEYVAADTDPVDSEELRDVNISKKELNDLVAELFDGLVQEGVILEDIQLSSPKKTAEKTPQKRRTRSDPKSELNSPEPNTNQFGTDLNAQPLINVSTSPIVVTQTPMGLAVENAITSNSKESIANKNISTIMNESQNSNINQQTPFKPNVMSTPSSSVSNQTVQIAANPQSLTTAPVIISYEKVQSQLTLSEVVDGSVGGVGTSPGKIVAASQPVQYMLSSNEDDPNGIITLIPVNIAYTTPKKSRLTIIPIPSASVSEASRPTTTSANFVNSGLAEMTLTDAVAFLSNQSFGNPPKTPTKPSASVVALQSTLTEDSSAKNKVACVSGTQRHQSQTTKQGAPITRSSEISAVLPTTVTNSTNNASQNNNATKAALKKANRPDPFEDFKKTYDNGRKFDLSMESEIDPSQMGFTGTMQSILQQQLRMHVQLIAQNFLQVYSHPMFWKYANVQKNMLLDFDKHFNKHKPSIYNIWNLKLALQLITDWEKQLSTISPENTAFMEFIYDEIEKSRRFVRLPHFSARILQIMMRSKVFIYPELLPHVPFRPVEPRYCEFIPSVDFLLAHTLYYAYREVEEYQRRWQNKHRKEITLLKVCRYITHWQIYPRTADTLRGYIVKKVYDKTSYNPIKYFFQHKKPPPYTHVLYELDFNNMNTPEERINALPKSWQEFAIKLRETKRQSNTFEPIREPSKELPAQNTPNITIQVNYVFDPQLNTTSVQYNNTSDYSQPSPYTPNVECNVNRGHGPRQPPALSEPPLVSVPSLPPAPVLSLPSAPVLSSPPAPVPSLPPAPVQSLSPAPVQSLRHAPVLSLPPPQVLSLPPAPVLSLPPVPVPTAPNLIPTQCVQPPQSVARPVVSYAPHEETSYAPTSFQSPKVEASYSQRADQTEFKYFTQLHEPLSSTRYSESLDWYKFGRNFESPSLSRATSVSPAAEVFSEIYTGKPPILVNNSGPHENRDSWLISNTNRFIDSWETTVPANYSRLLSQALSSDSLLPRGQKLVTDYFKVKRQNSPKPLYCGSKTLRVHLRRKYVKAKRCKLRRQRRFVKKLVKRRCLLQRQLKRQSERLLTTYRNSLARDKDRYENAILNRIFHSVRALELYITFLKDLEMNVKKMKLAEECASKKPATTAKATSGDEEVPKTRKPYRVGESLRQMLLPESKEDTNEKDATFAINFFDKVEETFCNAGHHERYESFQRILKKFDPQKERSADLYYKMENLFLPEYPNLAEVFIAFLLPSEAIEIGKFFEHFMITNMGNFINKLNIFFNKQPAQIKKIYAALGELAEEQDLNVEQVKNKIVPLLKGNKVLTDWFLQTFESEKPNQSISKVNETINLKQVESQQGEGEIHETVQQKDIIEESTDANACQLKYINGGIYYGSRILLPAKLNFLATELSKRSDEDEICTASDSDPRLGGSTKSCVHGFRECAERQIKNHLEKSEDNKKPDEESDKDKDKYTLCDDLTFKAHAARLNPALYQAPQHHHMPTSLKSRHSDGETSPKKQCLQKRRSPKKSLPKSPTITNKKVAASIPESSKAIGIAKKLKTITNGNESAESSGHLKPRRKQQKCTKNSGSDQAETSSQSGSESAASDSDRELKRKQPKLQSPTTTTTRPDDTSQHPIEACVAITPKVEVATPSPSPTPIESGSYVWTRDEDKIILEEVKSGYENESTLVTRLLLKLPQRTESEIVKRHQFLMEVLTQLQGKSS